MRCVKSVEAMQVARGVHGDVCHARGKEVERSPEPVARTARPARDDRNDTGIARHEPHDAGSLAVVEQVEDQGVGGDLPHIGKLSAGGYRGPRRRNGTSTGAPTAASRETSSGHA